MGAHTLGGAKPERSGYNGLWTPGREFVFDNEFYCLLIAKDIVYVNVANHPYDPIDVKWQWNLLGGGLNQRSHKVYVGVTGKTKRGMNRHGRGDEEYEKDNVEVKNVYDAMPRFNLNVDMELAYNIDVDDLRGTSCLIKVNQTQHEGLNYKELKYDLGSVEQGIVERRSISGITGTSGLIRGRKDHPRTLNKETICPDSSTKKLVQKYCQDGDLFLADFKTVYEKMMKRGQFELTVPA